MWQQLQARDALLAGAKHEHARMRQQLDSSGVAIGMPCRWYRSTTKEPPMASATRSHGWATFIHVPKTGGSSITAFFANNVCAGMQWHTPHTKFGPNHFVKISEALSDAHHPNAAIYLSLRDPAEL